MSTTPAAPARRITVPDLASRKGKAPIVALTAYTAPIASLLDSHVDILLVGDSLGMVVYGMDSTLAVTLDMMIAHGRAVVNASRQACVIVDMPFGSYQASPAQAFVSCARVMAETGCSAVKLEGGAEMAETITHLTSCGIPVLAHVGLMPQHVHTFGGFRYQGRNAQEREKILRDARAVEAAGAFAVVLESMAEPVAAEVTRALSIPTIGIGASPACDGQVLVVDDMLGVTAKAPRFARAYGSLRSTIEEAAAAYARDVRSRAFPATEHCFEASAQKRAL